MCPLPYNRPKEPLDHTKHRLQIEHTHLPVFQSRLAWIQAAYTTTTSKMAILLPPVATGGRPTSQQPCGRPLMFLIALPHKQISSCIIGPVLACLMLLRYVFQAKRSMGPYMHDRINTNEASSTMGISYFAMWRSEISIIWCKFALLPLPLQSSAKITSLVGSFLKSP